MKKLLEVVAEVKKGWMDVPERTLVSILCNKRLSNSTRHKARLALRLRKI